MYIFEEDRLLKELKARKPGRILLQLPEGLKKDALRLASFIQEKAKTEVIVSGEPCWGACDIAVSEARSIGADLIVLYGHAEFKKMDFPVLYLEARYEKNISKLTLESIKLLKPYKKVALVSSVQHLHQLPITERILKENNIEALIPKKKGFAFYDGQVLGCEYNSLRIMSKEFDAILVIANEFHALGASLAVNKETILIDPYNEKVYSMNPLRDKIIKQRAVAISKVKSAGTIGVIIGLKPGQKFGSFKYVTDNLKKLGKEFVIITMNEISPDKLTNLYSIDAFVELACPRIAIEDYSKLGKPVITAREFAVVAGDLEFEDLIEKGFL